MTKPRSVLLNCALALASAALLPAATISLDTVGADPDLTSPNFSFMTDEFGNYPPVPTVFRNVTNPRVDFLTLQITAPFSSGFYFGPLGPTPRGVGTSCDGGNLFLNCSITLLNASTTVVFDFFGIDANHPGVPYNREFSVVARQFEPNQIIGAQAATVPTSVPEPAAFGLALAGLVLCGLVVSRKQLLKFRVLAQRS